MAAPIAAGMLAQTLYFLIDRYFVAQLGDAALAGVGAAGIAPFVVMLPAFWLSAVPGRGSITGTFTGHGHGARAVVKQVRLRHIAVERPRFIMAGLSPSTTGPPRDP